MFARQQSAGRSFAGFASFMSWSKRKQTSLDWKKQKREIFSHNFVQKCVFTRK
jgi:hypothetical protein